MNYDGREAKEDVFSVQSGEERKGCSDLAASDTVYVIMEAGEECRNGEFRFQISYD